MPCRKAYGARYSRGTKFSSLQRIKSGSSSTPRQPTAPMSPSKLAALFGLILVAHGASAFMTPTISSVGALRTQRGLNLKMQRQGSMLERPETEEATIPETVGDSPVATKLDEILSSKTAEKATLAARGASNVLRSAFLQARSAKAAEAAKVANNKIAEDMKAYAEASAEARKMWFGDRTPQEMTEVRAKMLEMRAKRAEMVSETVNKDIAELMAKKAEEQTKFEEYYAQVLKEAEEIKAKTGEVMRTEIVERKTTTLTRQLEETAAMEREALDLLTVGAKRDNCPKDSVLLSEMAKSLAGNKGFDPLNLAQANMENGGLLEAGDTSGLMNMASAELKHARLAMLASVGAMAPTLGFDRTVYMGAAVTVFALLEMIGTKKDIKRVDAASSLPEDIGFDPMGTYATLSTDDKFLMRYREINNGRLAMMAMSVYLMNLAINGN